MTLSPVKVGEEHRYPIEPPAFTVDQVELPEDADEDMQRSVLNKDKVCKCGFTKQLKSESQPVISRDGHKKVCLFALDDFSGVFKNFSSTFST